jgi:hypothetical protein
MPRQFERYRFRDGVTPLSEDTFNRILSDVDLRIAALEALQVDWAAALSTVSDQGLERVAEAMSGPLADLAASVEALAAEVLSAQQAGMILDAPGTVTDTNLGTRTVVDTTVANDTATLTELLSGLANRVKAITGGANWRANPATTLAAVGTAVTNSTNHLASTTNPHQTTAAQVGALATTGGTLSGAVAMGNNAITGVKALGSAGEVDNGNSGSAKTISLVSGAMQKIALTATAVLTISTSGAVSGTYMLRIVNAGYYTVTWSGLSVSRWMGSSSVPAVAGGAGAETVVTMIFNGANLVQRMDRIGTA